MSVGFADANLASSMPRFHSGEGAVSTGPMVVVHETRTVVEARAVVELLEANQIPALVNLEIDGILFPWQEPPKGENARVLVPSTMLPLARDVIHRATAAARLRPKRFFGLLELRSGASMPAAERAPAVSTPRIIVEPKMLEPEPKSAIFEEDDEDTGPIDLELPEPIPLARRIMFAMLAIAFGTAFQRVLEHFLGVPATMARFAAQAPVLAEPWRLISASFLHMSPEHFLSNAVFGVGIGIVLFGTHEIGATALVWLLSSAVGLATEATLSPGAALIAGASAGNYGLVGLWAKGQLERSRASLLPRRERIRTIGILLLLVPGALTPVTSTGTKIAVLAHAAGFLAGSLMGFVFHRRLLPPGFARIGRRSRGALVATSVILLSGLAAFLLSS